MAFIRVDLPAPLVPIRPTTSPSPTSIETWSTATLPPKRTTTSVGPERGHARRERRPRPRPVRVGTAWRCFGGAGPRRRSDPLEDHPPGAVADLDQAAGEVEQEHEQADAGGEQRDQVVVREERGQADDPERAEHGAGDRAEAADHDDRHQQQRVGDGEVPVAGNRLDVARRAARRRAPARPPARANARSLIRVVDDRVRGGRVRVVAHRDRRPADAARRSRATTTTATREHGEDDVVEGALRRDVDAEHVGARQRHRVA